MKALLIAAAAALTLVTSASARTVHIYGDSIHKGWGYGTYTDVSPLNRIDRIATMLARDNRSALLFRRAGYQDPAEICRDRLTGTIRGTDTVLFEDAGPHSNDHAYIRRWLSLVAFCATPKRLTFTTMFDYQPNLPLSTYDEPFEGGPSVNTLVRQAARATRSRLLDWNAAMDAARALLEPQGVRLVHPDGIHPTVFGNIVLATSLLRHERVSVTRYERLLRLLVAEQKKIVAAGFAPEYDAARMRGWLRVLLRI